MFNTDLVRKGLAIQIAKAQEAKRTDTAKAILAVDHVKEQFGYRRMLLAETWQYYAEALNRGVEFTRAQLAGHDLSRLPENLQSQWRVICGKAYLSGDFTRYTSKEDEERATEAAKRESFSGNWEDSAIQVMENAALILAAFEGPNITYSTWERLGLRTQVLADAVAAGQLAAEEAAK